LNDWGNEFVKPDKDIDLINQKCHPKFEMAFQFPSLREGIKGWAFN
jgi:hypothetical protein